MPLRWFALTAGNHVDGPLEWKSILYKDSNDLASHVHKSVIMERIDIVAIRNLQHDGTGHPSRVRQPTPRTKGAWLHANSPSNVGNGIAWLIKHM